MAKFITNIALQDATEKDYIKLRNELKKDLFTNGTDDGRSKAYVSGKGVFTKEGNISIKDVNDAVSKAASKTGRKFSFYVIKNKQVANLN